MLNDKNILITGGTGTIGMYLTEYILKNSSAKIIRILSRDDTKQSESAERLKKYKERLRFFIGDVRDKERLDRALVNVDIVFHLAALKHVIACEYNPFEAVKTNVLGIQNLIQASIDNNIEKVVFTSSDKAATPCNTMGVTKLLGEKLITSANYYKANARTIFYSVRFGNVLGSRGSIIPIIKKQIENEKPVTLTHKDMTRFIMSSDIAISLILKTLNIAQGGEVFVPKMDSIRILDLIKVLVEIFSDKQNGRSNNIQINEVGMTDGEKLYEELFSIEESERTYELDDIYLILPQLTEVTKKIDLTKYPNIKKFDSSKPFISKDGPFLSKEEIKAFLFKNNIIK